MNQKINLNVNLNSFSSIVNENNEYDYSSDGDDDIEIKNTEEPTKINLDYANPLKRILDTIDLHIFLQETKHIILFNDKDFTGKKFVFEPDDMYNGDLGIFKSTDICCGLNIDIEDPITYFSFLSNLTKFSLNVKRGYEEVIELFELYPFANANDLYIDLKSSYITSNVLRGLIYKRLKEQKNQNQFETLIAIEKEMVNIYPPIDQEFSDELNMAINEFIKKIAGKHKIIIEKEIKISSLNNLKYLLASLRNKSYLFDDELDILDSHNDFLTKEYYSIIRELYQGENIVHMYNQYKNILDNQMNDDKYTIINIVKRINEQTASSTTNKSEESTNTINTGTNYTIRETESVREIQVLVQSGHLKDVIEQDF